MPRRPWMASLLGLSLLIGGVAACKEAAEWLEQSNDRARETELVTLEQELPRAKEYSESRYHAKNLQLEGVRLCRDFEDAPDLASIEAAQLERRVRAFSKALTGYSDYMDLHPTRVEKVPEIDDLSNAATRVRSSAEGMLSRVRRKKFLTEKEKVHIEAGRSPMDTPADLRRWCVPFTANAGALDGRRGELTF